MGPVNLLLEFYFGLLVFDYRKGLQGPVSLFYVGLHIPELEVYASF
jgi:hypothetical protein